MSQNQLIYKAGDQFFPIPPEERGLQTVEAEHFLTIYERKDLSLEGLCFDRNGDLYLTDVLQGRILKVDMETKKVSTIYQTDPEKKLMAAAVKIHKNGRLFLCCCAQGGRSLTKFRNNGCIISVNPDGTDPRTIIEGYNINDMAFDSNGGIYFGDYVGTSMYPTGGIYYIDPDFNSVKPVVLNLASPNGLCLNKAEDALWIAEMATGNIIKYMLKSDMSYIHYHISGAQGPDSMSIDNDDNVYCAIYRQARVMVFNKNGLPIGQVVLPGREKGENLGSTHPMIRPGTNELYICSYDDSGDWGASIFKAGAFASANMSLYQYK